MRTMIKFNSDAMTKIQGIFGDLYYLSDKKIIRGELDFCSHYINVGCEGIDDWNIEGCDRNMDDCVEDAYSIEIHLDEAPGIDKTPAVYETEKRIEKLAKSLGKSSKDLHINSDRSCCLGIFSPSDHLSLYEFVTKRVYPYFVWQAYFSRYRKIPPCGELPHDCRKAIDIRITDEKNNLKLVLSKQIDNPIGKNRNKMCLCGSGKKYKKCCLKSDQKVDEDNKISKIKTRIPLLEKMKKENSLANNKKLS